MESEIITKGKAALQEFQKNGKIPNFSKLIKITNDYGVLKCIFEEEFVLWEAVSLYETRSFLKHSLGAYEETKSINSLKLATYLACTDIHNYSTNQLLCCNFETPEIAKKWAEFFIQLQPKIQKIWLDGFQEYPDFLKLLKEYNQTRQCPITLD